MSVSSRADGDSPQGMVHAAPRPALIGALLVLGTLAIFSGALGNEFVGYDDPGFVTERFEVRAGLGLDGLRWAFTTLEFGQWAPLTWLSHMMDVELYGLAPAGHHLTSVVLHALSVLLLFSWLRRDFGGLWQSAIATALFAIHPLRVESVAWVAERRDVLAGVFFFAALLSHSGYVERGGRLRLARTTLLFALGLLAKPMVITLPFVLLLLDVWPHRRLRREGGAGPGRLLAEKLPLFALATGSAFITLAAQRSAHSVATLQGFTLVGRVTNSASAYVAYLGKTFWPVDLAVHYPLRLADLTPQRLAASLIILGLLTALVMALRKERPALLFGWLWFLGTLVPMIGMVQVGAQAFADRYSYVPSVGLAIAIAWGAWPTRLATRCARLVVGTAGFAVVAVLGALSVAQVARWEDTETLFAHALEAAPDNPVADVMITGLRLQSGELQEAELHASRAYQLDPTLPVTQRAMGMVHLARNEPAAAIPYLKQALIQQPSDPGHEAALAQALYRSGRKAEGLALYRDLLSRRPTYVPGHLGLGIALASEGETQAALQAFATAADLAPEAPDPQLNLGIALAESGRLDEARAALERALQLDPDLAAARRELATVEERQRNAASSP